LWQQAQDFAEAVVRLAGQLPSNRTTDSTARQLVRAATSVAANIAEGHGRFSFAAYKNHLSIAKGSACEADSWLDLLRRLDLITPEREADLHDRCTRLIAALTKRIRDLERSSQSIREERAAYDASLEDEDETIGDGSKVPGFNGS
jgi:four helix bundle protein